MIIKQKCFDELRDAIACVVISARGGMPEGGFSEAALKNVNACMFYHIAKILEEYEDYYGDEWQLEDENGKIVEFEAGSLVDALYESSELCESEADC